MVTDLAPAEDGPEGGGHRRPGEPPRLRLRERGSWSEFAGRGWTRDSDPWPPAHLRPAPYPTWRPGAPELCERGVWGGEGRRRRPSAAAVPHAGVFFSLNSCVS